MNDFGETVSFIWSVADFQDSDEYRAQSVVWVPPESCWAQLKAQARRPSIGQLPSIALSRTTVGDEASRAKDVLDRGHEYFSQFASAEGLSHAASRSLERAHA